MEFRSGSIYVRQTPHLLETGYVVEGHKHNFDHTTFFGQGVWKVECFGDVYADGKLCKGQLIKLREVTIRGGSPHSFLLIEADKHHTLTLIEGPGCYSCVYSHRTPEGDVTPEYTGWNDAYV